MQTTVTEPTMGDAKVAKKTAARTSKDGKWRYLPKVPNLLQYVATSQYFARAKVDGKTIRLKLDTDVFTTAKVLLPDKIKTIRKPAPVLGTFAEARVQYEADLDTDHTLSEGTRYYRKNCLKALKKTWPALDGLFLRKIAVQACHEWAQRFLKTGYDEQYFNNTLGTMRQILKRGGLQHDESPARDIKRLGVKPKRLELPEYDQFDRILRSIETAGSRHSQHCAALVRFLAFSGCRISEARLVKWADVDLDRGEIRVKNAKRSRTSNSAETRFVPIIPPMRALLTRLKSEREVILPLLREHQPELVDRVCLVGECEKSLSSACRKVEAKRITHHDLRHLFATRCIESGVDIPTVARWLGHVDGGALAMRVYGHLRREHSTAMAQKVTFASATKPDNVVQLPLLLVK